MVTTTGDSSPHAGADVAQRARVRADSLQLFLAQWRGTLAGLGTITLSVFATGRVFAPSLAWNLWVTVVGVNTLAQAAICLAMEREPSPQSAVHRWLPWLISSIGVNAFVWGLLPFMAAQSSPSSAILPALLNGMLLFCVASSPGTHGMQWIATAAVAVTNTPALLQAGFHLGAVGYLVMVAAIGFYGWRHRTALDDGLLRRYEAEQLATELRANQERLVAMERERTLLLERQRLTRDMHDGLGSTLAASLAAAERGELPQDSMASILRDCIDDLRTVIDSLEPFESDMSVLLGTLRFRMEPRLEKAGVMLHWAVDDLPPLTWLGPPAAIHIMRVVQETLANVVRHSSAKNITISARPVGDEIEVLMADDGDGFDPAAVRLGRGLRSLKERATAVGGRIEIHTAPGRGTSVNLRVPVVQNDDAVAGNARVSRKSDVQSQ